MARLLQAVCEVNTKQICSGYHLIESSVPIPFPDVVSLGNNLYRAPYTIIPGQKEVGPSLLERILCEKTAAPASPIETRTAPVAVVQPIAKPVEALPPAEKSVNALNLQKSPRQNFNGHSLTGLLRALGKAGWDEKKTKKLLKKLKLSAADSTIIAWLRRGKEGLYGAPAKLTKDDWAQLNGLV